MFTPLLERFGRSDVVFAWDLMNEPEWATLGAGGYDPGATVARRTMRAFLGELREAARDRVTQPVTVGLASLAGLSLVRELGLDFYQVHWYDSLGRRHRPERPVGPLGLDRPLVLGEFPTRGSAYTAGELLQAARDAGYAGAFAWSVLAEDAFSAGVESATAVAAWARGTKGQQLA